MGEVAPCLLLEMQDSVLHCRLMTVLQPCVEQLIRLKQGAFGMFLQKRSSITRERKRASSTSSTRICRMLGSRWMPPGPSPLDSFDAQLRILGLRVSTG